MLNPTASIPDTAPTNKTIAHSGRLYAIHTTTHPAADSPWVLVSKRGLAYALTRNKTNLHHLFGIALTGRLSVLPGWFTDEGGELRSLG